MQAGSSVSSMQMISGPFACDVRHLLCTFLNSSIPVTKIAEFANNVDLGEVADNEPPHLDLYCLPSSL